MRTKEETLARAAADVRDLPDRGVPNVYWPFREGNYCAATVTHWLDDFGGHPAWSVENISIRALRADRETATGKKGWTEGTKPKAGALVLMNFAGGRTAEHIGLCRGPLKNGTVPTYEGNTGPRPGVPNPNGFYARERDPRNIVGYIYPPYPSSSTQASPAKEEIVKAPGYHSFKKNVGLVSGAWKTLELEKKGLYSAIGTPGSYVVRASFAFKNLPPESVVQVRFVVVKLSATGKVVGDPKGLVINEIHGSAGRSFGILTDLVTLGKDERLRVQALGDSAIIMDGGDVKWTS
jgi:hypothetical protein